MNVKDRCVLLRGSVAEVQICSSSLSPLSLRNVCTESELPGKMAALAELLHPAKIVLMEPWMCYRSARTQRLVEAN